VPKPPNIIRPTYLKTAIPEDMRVWLDIHLWSASEQRVPHGAYARLIQQLLREYRAKVESNRDHPVP